MLDRRRKDPTEFAAEILAIQLALWQQPLASVADLLARPDLLWASKGTIKNRLGWMVERDYVGFVVRGWTQRAQQRFYLHTKGIWDVMDRLGVPLDWSVTEPCLKRLLRQGPAVELLYEVAPVLWTSDVVHPLWRQPMPMKRLRLISSGPIMAVAEYELRAPGDANSSRVLVVFAWYGIRPKRSRIPDELSRMLAQTDLQQEPSVESPPAPCGLVILAADRLAVLRARLELHADVPRAIVTLRNRSGDGVIEALRPAPDRGRLPVVTRPAARIGSPEHLPDFVAIDNVQSCLQTVSDYRILAALEEWSGCSERQWGKLAGDPKEVGEVVPRYMEKGLVDRDDRLSLHPTGLVQEWAVERDRLARRRSRGRPGAERSGTGRRREHMRRHEEGLIELAIAFRRAGALVEPGWKLRLNLAGGTQIAPDLWALIPVGDGRAVWHAVEYERSAKTPQAIEKKLWPYRVAHQLGESVPMLMVCETERASARFAEQRGAVPMLVAKYRDITRGFHLAKLVWLWNEEATDVTHLSTVAWWTGPQRERLEYLLWERRV